MSMKSSYMGYMERVSDDYVETIADILGPFSAAAQALKEAKLQREQKSFPIAIFKTTSSFIVGPDIEEIAKTHDKQENPGLVK